MNRDDVDALLEMSHDPDERVRARAVRELCPCAVRANLETVWERVLEMQDDPAVIVRKAVLHTLCDGSPRALEARVAAALERMQSDDDPKLRRHARRIMAEYRRTGCLNVA